MREKIIGLLLAQLLCLAAPISAAAQNRGSKQTSAPQVQRPAPQIQHPAPQMQRSVQEVRQRQGQASAPRYQPPAQRQFGSPIRQGGNVDHRPSGIWQRQNSMPPRQQQTGNTNGRLQKPVVAGTDNAGMSNESRTPRMRRFDAPRAPSSQRSQQPSPSNVAGSTSVVVNNYHHYDHNGGHIRQCNFWWGGGRYFGAWYDPGWYYPSVVYPGFYYSSFFPRYGWMGYEYGYSPYITEPGVKFDLNQVPKKEREAMKNAGVYLPDENGKMGYLGTVGQFSGSWHHALPLGPGTYDLTIAFGDGRELNISVTVQPQRVTHVVLRFDKPAQGQNDLQQEEPADTGNNGQLVPTPSHEAETQSQQ